MNTIYSNDFSNHPISLLYEALRGIYFKCNIYYDMYDIDDIESLILLNNGCTRISNNALKYIPLKSDFIVKIFDSKSEAEGNRVLEAYDYTETSGYKTLYIFASYFADNTLKQRPEQNDNTPESIIKRNYGNQMVFEKLRKITEMSLVSMYGSHIFTEPFAKTSAGMTFSKLTTIIPAKILNEVLPIEPCDITSRNIPFDKLKILITHPIMLNILGIDYYE